MRVKLRQLKRNNGTITLRLDTFLGYYTDEKGTRKAKRIRETLPLHIAPEDAISLDVRQSILQQAEHIRFKKERELQETGLYPYFKKRKSNTSLLLYLEAYIGSQKQHKSNIALWRGLQKRLELVCSREMQFKDVNVAFCQQVLSSLIQGSTNGELKPLAPNTVKNYFSRFIRFLRHAKKEGLLKTVPKFQPKLTPSNNNRSYLRSVEIQELKNAFCSNQDLKNGFLFAVETGLYFHEIQKLKWSNIQNENKLWLLDVPGRPTANGIRLKLSPDAIALLGEPGPNSKLVFPRLKSTQESNIQLLKWAVKANLGKPITFSISRKTYAYLSVSKKLSLNTINLGLGHKDLKTTQQFLTSLKLKVQKPSASNSTKALFLSKSHSSQNLLSKSIRLQLRNYNHVFIHV